MQNRLIVAVVLALLWLAPALAEQPASPMGGMGMARANMGMKPAGEAKRSQRCTPMIDDYYWLDYSRGMGMNRSGGEARRKDQGSANKEKRSASNRSWRMRLLRLKRNGFPPEKDGMRRYGNSAIGKRPGDTTKMPAGKPKMPAKGRKGAMGAADATLANAIFWLDTPDRAISRVEIKNPGVMTFSSRQGGQHKIFSYLDAGVRDGTRHKYFNFYRYFSHGDKAAKKERPFLNSDGYWMGSPEFELEPIYADDDQAYSTQTGQDIRFRVNLRGRPVKGVCVVIMTEKGWRNAKRTDENGEVSFFLIKESESDGGWRTRRRAGKYLVVARHAAAVSDARAGLYFADTRFTATMSLRVRHSKLEWESKSTAFIVVAFTVILAGAAIAIRRTRRRKAAVAQDKREG